MRAMILLAGAALAISGCGGKDSAQNATEADSDLGTRTIASNDTTSIDAVSGEDANMAAETTIMPPEEGNDSSATANDAENSGNSAENGD